MKALYRFEFDYGRMGFLSGLFVAEVAEVDRCIGKNWYVMDVLGKHSEIKTPLNRDDLDIITTDQVFIEQILLVFGSENLVGFNPLECII